jgi:hypothetical protein
VFSQIDKFAQFITMIVIKIKVDFSHLFDAAQNTLEEFIELVQG